MIGHESETHTTDLTCSCKRQRQLTLDGKALGETPTALFTGIAGHGALETLHREFDPESWDSVIGSACVERGVEIAFEKSQAEGRPITAAVESNAKTIQAELEGYVCHYAERFREYFMGVELIGCELPVRCPIVVDGEIEDFASHIDLAFVGPDWWDAHAEYTLKVWDWKFRQDAPGPEHVRRDLQLGAYAYAMAHGKFMRHGCWHEMPCTHVSVSVVDMKRCKPYGTSKKNADGGYVYRKGDVRDLRKIVHSRVIGPEGMARWADDFCDHVRMKRLGIWPRTPDAIGCQNCDVRVHCEGYSDE